MKKILLFLFSIVMACSAGGIFFSVQNQVCAAERTDEPISPANYQKMLGKGMDADWAKTGAGQRQYSETAVKKFKQAGISHVRIRVKDAASEKLFQILDRQINGGRQLPRTTKIILTCYLSIC